MPAETPPLLDPASYPGTPVTVSCLVTGADVHPLTASGDVGDWRLGPDRLDDVLRALGGTPMAGRRPVLAVGSNASPSQLWHKFARRGPEFAVPVCAVQVRGLAVGHSAHVSPAGYIPYAPYADGGRTLRGMLLWPDGAQLARLDETERNYDRVSLASADYRLRLESGADLAGYFVYRSVHGVVAGLPATTQVDVLTRLARRPGFADAVPEGLDVALTSLARSPQRRAALTRVLAGYAVDAGLRVG
jgi:hypothetical protein